MPRSSNEYSVSELYRMRDAIVRWGFPNWTPHSDRSLTLVEAMLTNYILSGISPEVLERDLEAHWIAKKWMGDEDDVLNREYSPSDYTELRGNRDGDV